MAASTTSLPVSDANRSPQPKARVELLDHTADVGVRVHADSPTAAFAAVAEAMFDVMVDRDQIEEVQTWEVRVEAEGWEDLLVVWLEELLYRYEMDLLVPHRCHIEELSPTHLLATLHGDRLDRAKHDTGVQIKAVTYHQLMAEETPEGFVVQVIFDI